MKKGIQKYNNVYQEIADLIGEEQMLVLFEHLRGMQISFPSRLYTKEFVRNEVTRLYDGKNLKELANRYDYTMKYLTTLINENSKGDI